MSLAPRPPRWLEPEGPHSVENIGDRPYHALRIEVKPPLSNGITGGMSDRVANHFRLFNDAVRRKDWTEFLGTFAPDAVMRFENVPAGPYEGLDAIRAAYHERPPDDTMHYVSGDRDADEDVVRFGWDAGGGGTLRMRWRDGKVATLTIAFGAS
jgi:steroid Delta-isomerase